jgi:hypothetical protein
MAMKLVDLKDGMEVTLRTGRHGETAPVWGEWFTATLYVRRRDRALRSRGRVRPAGEIIELASDGFPATYTESHYSNGVFDIGGHLLEIQGLE